MRPDTTMWYAIAILVVVSVTGYAIYAARRTRKQQEQKSQERAAAMLVALQQEATRAREAADSAINAAVRVAATTAGGAGSIQAAVAVSPAAAVVATPVQPAAKPVLRRHMLSGEQRLVYLLLRSGLPDCIVLPGLRLTDLLEAAPGPRAWPDGQDADALRIDFVVCSRALEPLAAILVQHDDNADAASDAPRIAALRDLDLKLLRVRADSLPRPTELRGFVLG